MSCWYVTPVCLQADSPIGKRGQGRAVTSGPYGSSRAHSAVHQTAPADSPPESSKGLMLVVLTSRKGSWRRLTIPERRPVPPCSDHMHKGRGGIRVSPAGAHSLQLWSAAAQPNTRQHLQLSALKRPKKFRSGSTRPASVRDRTVSIPGWVVSK